MNASKGVKRMARTMDLALSHKKHNCLVKLLSVNNALEAKGNESL